MSSLIPINVGIIGGGNIGREVLRRARKKGWNVTFVARGRGIFTPTAIRDTDPSVSLDRLGEYIEKTHLVFLAIPTKDDGLTAYNYIRACLDAGKLLVTAEKGALANYFEQLRDELSQIGYSAAVGGGTGMLGYLRQRIGPTLLLPSEGGPYEIHAVVNGTLNYILDALAKGRPADQVLAKVLKRGYAEPGAKSLLDVINQEAAKDIPMKLAVLFNTTGLGSMQARDVECSDINQTDLDQLISEADSRRYIVSITRQDNGEDMIGGFQHQVGPWHISAGFKRIEANPLFAQLRQPGVKNTLLISEGEQGRDGFFTLVGDGAGANPTAGAMIEDARELLLKARSQMPVV